MERITTVKDHDIQLANKAKSKNKQRFIKALKTQNGLQFVARARVHFGIPEGGFSSEAKGLNWLEGFFELSTKDRLERQGLVRDMVSHMLAQLKLTSNFSQSARHLLLTNEIDYLPYNFSICINHVQDCVTINEYAPLTGPERKLLSKFKKRLHDSMGRISTRDKKNEERDEEILRLSRDKIPRSRNDDEYRNYQTQGNDSDIVAQAFKDERASSQKQVDKSKVIVRQVRARAKKRDTNFKN